MSRNALAVLFAVALAIGMVARGALDSWIARRRERALAALEALDEDDIRDPWQPRRRSYKSMRRRRSPPAWDLRLWRWSDLRRGYTMLVTVLLAAAATLLAFGWACRIVMVSR